MFGKLTQALKRGLQKTRDKLAGGLRAILPFGRELNEALITEMEEYLLTADIGPRTVMKIMDQVRKAYREKRIRTTDECYAFLKDILKAMLREDGSTIRTAPSGPTVVLVAGVNGSGKTTSIAKLAWRLTRRVTFDLKYDFNKRTSDTAPEYRENRLWLTLSFGRGEPRSGRVEPAFGIDESGNQ